MIGFIRLHKNEEEVVFINPEHIVKMEELAYPRRTLISTMDDTVTTVCEAPYEIIEEIRRINHVL